MPAARKKPQRRQPRLNPVQITAVRMEIIHLLVVPTTITVVNMVHNLIMIAMGTISGNSTAQDTVVIINGVAMEAVVIISVQCHL